MSIRSINEAFDKEFGKEPIKEEKEKHFDLLMALKRAREALMRDRVANLKAYEIAYQNVIEDYFPDKSWWEVTDCNIFNDLMETRDPEKTEINIIKGIKDDVDENITEEVTEDDVDLNESSGKRTFKVHYIDNTGAQFYDKIVANDEDEAESLLLDKADTFINGVRKVKWVEDITDNNDELGVNESLKEDVTIIEEIALDDFDFWGPAEKIYSLMTDNEKKAAEEFVAELYPNGIGKTELNDLFAYDDNFIC